MFVLIAAALAAAAPANAAPAADPHAQHHQQDKQHQNHECCKDMTMECCKDHGKPGQKDCCAEHEKAKSAQPPTTPSTKQFGRRCVRQRSVPGDFREA